MLRDIEYLATLASIYAKDYKYPKKDIDDIWENVLLCQFHDVLPGSSIEMVYEDASKVQTSLVMLLMKIYSKVFSTGQKLLSDTLNALGFKDTTTRQEEKVQVAINTLAWPRSEIVPLSTDELGDQKEGDKKYAVVSTESFGITTLDPIEVQHQMVGSGATSTSSLSLS
jgi:alpha-mannosidase